MPTERITRLFRIGEDQTILIPRELELPDGEALIYEEGDRLIIAPIPRSSLLAVLSTWGPLNEEFAESDDLEAIEDVNL